MKHLLTLLLVTVVLVLCHGSAKADCQDWENYALTNQFVCGDYGDGMQCYQITVCEFPDGTVDDGGGSWWYSLADSYAELYGEEPSEIALWQYYMNCSQQYTRDGSGGCGA
jgi:hypothetical protein